MLQKFLCFFYAFKLMLVIFFKWLISSTAIFMVAFLRVLIIYGTWEALNTLVLIGAYLFKACDCYFLSNFYFSQNDSPLKNYEKCFLFHLKSSFRSRDIQIFAIFPLLFHTFQIQKDKWKWNDLWCHELTCINFQM